MDRVFVPFVACFQDAVAAEVIDTQCKTRTAKRYGTERNTHTDSAMMVMMVVDKGDDDGDDDNG